VFIPTNIGVRQETLKMIEYWTFSSAYYFGITKLRDKNTQARVVHKLTTTLHEKSNCLIQGNPTFNTLQGVAFQNICIYMPQMPMKNTEKHGKPI
jgi:hypothetical protein